MTHILPMGRGASELPSSRGSVQLVRRGRLRTKPSRSAMARASRALRHLEQREPGSAEEALRVLMDERLHSRDCPALARTLAQDIVARELSTDSPSFSSPAVDAATSRLIDRLDQGAQSGEANLSSLAELARESLGAAAVSSHE